MMAPLLQSVVLMTAHAVTDVAAETANTVTDVTAQATEHAAQAAEHVAHHGPEPYTMAWLLETNVFNILLVGGILWFIIVKFDLHKMFHQKQEAVAKELSALYEKRQQAQEELKAIQAQTSNLSDEVETILANARHASQEMSDNVLAQARLEAESIVTRAKERVGQEEKHAVAQLKQQILKDAVAEAKQSLANGSASDKEASVKAFVSQLGRLPASKF